MNKSLLTFAKCCINFLSMPGIPLEEFELLTPIGILYHKNKWSAVLEHTGDNTFAVHISDVINMVDIISCESEDEFCQWLFTKGIQFDALLTIGG